MSTEPITITVIPDKDRLKFPGEHFKNDIFDVHVFAMADQLLKGYNGGYWEYAETNTGAAFMLPKADHDWTVVNPFSGVEVTVSPELAGMIVTSYTVLWAIEKGYDLYGQHDVLNATIAQYCNQIDRMDVWSEIMD